MRTIQQAAQCAIDVQDACNLSGVLGAFKDIVHDTIWPEARRLGKGTEWVNKHAICTLFLDKLADLNCPGREAGTVGDFHPAYEECHRLANEGKEAKEPFIKDPTCALCDEGDTDHEH